MRNSQENQNPFHQLATDSVGGHLPLDDRAPKDDAVHERPARRRVKVWRWLLVGTNLCVGGIAVGAAIWLLALPPTPKCDELSPLAPDMERLYCAQAAARSGEVAELLAGLNMLEQWTPEHPLYNEAQRWINDWSTSVLAIARRHMLEGDLPKALELVNQIPPSSQVYPQAKEAIAAWKALWDEGNGVVAKVQDAMQQQQWELASAHIRSLETFTHDYWRFEQAQALSQQLWAERLGRKTLADAQKQAKPGTLAALSTALTTATRIQPNTHVYREAQGLLNQWSDRLLTDGFDRWTQGQVQEAIALAQIAEKNAARATQAQQLIRLSQARQLAMSTVATWTPAPQHLTRLQEAIAAAQTIPAESPYYATAQSSLQSWQMQLEDVRHLLLAQVTASLGRIDTFRWAIAQAQHIAPQRPRRLQAQTLVAYWRREIERLEDQPILVRARQLAAPNTVPALKAAIAQAQRVELGRARRGEAQGLIYDWMQQIQTIEDQPLLNLAQSLARRGRLADAIRTATAIRSERALYPQAQRAIASWRGQIRRAELAEQARQRAAEAARMASPDPSPTPAPSDASPDRSIPGAEPPVSIESPAAPPSATPTPSVAPSVEAPPPTVTPPLEEPPRLPADASAPLYAPPVTMPPSEPAPSEVGPTSLGHPSGVPQISGVAATPSAPVLEWSSAERTPPASGG